MTISPPNKDCSLPSAEALRLAREFVDDPDLRAQVKVKIAIDGHPLIADMIDEAVVMAREIIRLSEQTPSAREDRDATLEEAARICERYNADGYSPAAKLAAQAIREKKSQYVGEKK